MNISLRNLCINLRKQTSAATSDQDLVDYINFIKKHKADEKITLKDFQEAIAFDKDNA